MEKSASGRVEKDGLETGLESLERRPSQCLFREMFIKVKSVDPEVWILKMMSDAILHNVHTSKTKTCESVLSLIWWW